MFLACWGEEEEKYILNKDELCEISFFPRNFLFHIHLY